MPYFSIKNIAIKAIATAVPTQVITVDSFIREFGEEAVQKFKNMTGVEQYRKTSKFQTASDLGFVAAKKIIKKKNIDINSIGALIFVAHSTDYRRPATACVLHKRLKLSKECFAFDIGLGCSAFVYGLQAVSSMMQCSDINRALLITGETLTKMTYPKDRSAVMLFGDAGSAILLEKEEGPDIKGILRSDGNGYRAIIAPAGGFRNIDAPKGPMTWADGNQRTLYNTHMDGTEVFNFTITDVPATIKDFMVRTNTSVNDYDCFIMHQANKFIHKQLSKKLKIPAEKMPLSLDRYGNSSAAAIPLTLCDQYGNSRRDQNLKALMCGFGVGLSWGVVSAKLNVNDIYPIIETDEYFAEGIINSPDDM